MHLSVTKVTVDSVSGRVALEILWYNQYTAIVRGRIYEIHSGCNYKFRLK